MPVFIFEGIFYFKGRFAYVFDIEDMRFFGTDIALCDFEYVGEDAVNCRCARDLYVAVCDLVSFETIRKGGKEFF